MGVSMGLTVPRDLETLYALVAETDLMFMSQAAGIPKFNYMYSSAERERFLTEQGNKLPYRLVGPPEMRRGNL